MRLKNQFVKTPVAGPSYAILLGALLTLQVVPDAVSAQTGQDSASVQAFYTKWFAAAPNDPSAYASFYAPNGQLYPPGEQPVVGRQAIAAWFGTALQNTPYRTIPQGLEVEEMRFLSPDWVVHRTRLWGVRQPHDGSPVFPFETRYFDLLHRTGTTWAVAYRMWSDDTR